MSEKETSVYTYSEGNDRFIVMSEQVYSLRKSIWRTINLNRGKLPDNDVAMALCLVQYELIHHKGDIHAT